MVKPIPIKLYETLSNLLGMYTYNHEEVLVLEAVANAIDAKAKKIDISFENVGDTYYVIFHNDGTPMSRQDFENYHWISLSSKTKGDSIGFAGVGAKIFLASPDGGEIITTTGKDGDSALVSRMIRTGHDVGYETSLDKDLYSLIGKRKIQHKYGTSYKVRLSSKAYQHLKQRIENILQFWFNYAIMSKKLQLTVQGKTVNSWEPQGEKVTKIVDWKNQKITCYFWICKDDTPEEHRHIIYSVFGKRIKNEYLDFAYQIKGDKSNKVFCLADVSVLAKWLNSNKEDFIKNFATNDLRSKIKSAFHKFLDEKGLLQKSIDKGISSNVVINELTKRIDQALQSKDLKFLNPFSNPRTRFTLVRDKNGEITVTELDGAQKGKGTKGGTDNGDGVDIGGEDTGPSLFRDKDGKLSSKEKQQKSRGLAIIIEDYPNDPREGWVDYDNKGVVYNSAHKFNQLFQEKNTFDYNLARVVISSLIKYRNDQVHMDAKMTLEYLEKILHSVW